MTNQTKPTTRELVQATFPDRPDEHLSDLVWSLIGNGSPLHFWADTMARKDPRAIQDQDGFYDYDTNNVLYRSYIRAAFQGWINHDTDVLELIAQPKTERN